MKSFEINALGLSEMTAKEATLTNGGSVVAAIIAIVALIALAVVVETVPGGVELGPYEDNWGKEPLPGYED